MTSIETIEGTHANVLQLNHRIQEVRRVLNDMTYVVGLFPSRSCSFGVVVDWFAKHGPGFPQLDTVNNALTLLERAIRQANYPMIVNDENDAGDQLPDRL